MKDQTQTPSLPPMLQQAQDILPKDYIPGPQADEVECEYELNLPLPGQKVAVRLKTVWTSSEGLVFPIGVVAYDEIKRLYKGFFRGGIWSFEVYCVVSGMTWITAGLGDAPWVETSGA